MPTPNRIRRGAAVLAATLICGLLGWPVPGAGQSADSGPELTQPLIDAAKSQGLSVVVISPPPPADVTPEALPSGGAALASLGAGVTKEIERLASAVAAPGWPARSSDPMKPLLNGVLTVIGLGVGLVVVHRAGLAFLIRPAAGMPGTAPLGRPARIARAGLGIAITSTATMVLPFVVHGAGSKTVELVGTIDEVFLRCAVIFLIVAPLLERAHERSAATHLRWDPRSTLRDFRIALTTTFLFTSAAWTLAFMYPDPAFEMLARLSYAAVVSGLAIFLAWRNRRALALFASSVLTGRLSPFGKSALGLVIGYVLLASLIACIRILLSVPDAVDVVLAPFAALLGGVAVYHLSLWIISLILRRDVQLATAPGVAPAHAVLWPVRLARALGAVAAVLLAFDRLGFAMRRPEGTLAALPATALVLLIAYAVWAYASEVIDRRIALEIGPEVEQDGEAEAGPGRTRLATLLPLLKNALQVTIAFFVVLMLLYEAGVNTTPIFASAGILGLAIGFGAQSLVKDIISGLFFLLDDAFRLGEYIETGGLKGTVERISIRSMQLRHQNGPLNTVAFGSISELTNYSRDWVIMKLPIKVELDTDPERVRKLVKKLGVELLEDPVIGGKFLEPLKSQGVLTIDNWGMTIRVKFKTRPGDQFVVRRVVYAKLHDMFEHEGIRFASRDVRVRVHSPADQAGADEAAIAAGASQVEETATATAANR